MAVAAISKKLGRPIKFIADRLESFTTDIHARCHKISGKLGVDKEGKILAMEINDLSGIGPFSMYPRTSAIETNQVLNLSGAPYVIPNYKAIGTVVFQNKTPMCQYRAVGHPIAVAITEALIDKAANKIDIGLSEIRKKNFIPDNAYPNKTPSGVPLEDLSHQASMDKLLTMMNIQEIEKEKIASLDKNVLSGYGVISMCEVTNPSPLLDFNDVAKCQVDCPDLISLQAKPDLHILPLPVPGGSLWCDFSTGIARPVLPFKFRRTAFDVLHALSHPGIRSSRRLIVSRFLWPGMNSDCNTWARSCLSCQKAKVIRHERPVLQEIPIPVRRFDHIHVDIVGPLPPSEGFAYLFTIIDRTTRWPEAIPIADISASTCARALFSHWISRFGVPAMITSDRGAQFTSSLWSRLCDFMGTKQSMTTAFHPQSNGIVERFHRSLKASLRARLCGPKWTIDLPLVLLGLRSSPRDSDGVSTAERVYGTTLCLPDQFLSTPYIPSKHALQQYRSVIEGAAPPPTNPKQTNSEYISPDLMTSDFVFVKRMAHAHPLAPQYLGPYKVLERKSNVFKLQVGNKTEIITVHRLKPCFSDIPVQEEKYLTLQREQENLKLVQEDTQSSLKVRITQACSPSTLSLTVTRLPILAVTLNVQQKVYFRFENFIYGL